MIVHYSGILVTTRPNEVRETIRDLETLPGISVHYCYPETGRLIAVQEADSAGGQQTGLRRIQELPRVLLAAVVEHRIEGDPA